MKVKEPNRAISVSQLMVTTHRVMHFDGVWLAAFGEPELTGSWLIWGNSSNDKTRFALQLCKYLTRFGRVAYNSLEEGASKSMKQAFIDLKIEDVKRNFVLLDREPVGELIERLSKRKSPDIIAIDSLQYSGLTIQSYKTLVNRFRNKLFILISHADGRNPSGRVASSIRFDAMVKIRVEGYRAFPVSRYGGGEPYVIWDAGSIDYWGI